jgi:hypothetical protein
MKVNGRRRSVGGVATCLSPFCEGEVVEETTRAGRCRLCGLRHGRQDAASKWDHLVGPLIVTLSEATTAAGSTVPDGLERVDAKAVRFVGLGSRKFVTIDEAAGPIWTTLLTRLVSITMLD